MKFHSSTRSLAAPAGLAVLALLTGCAGAPRDAIDQMAASARTVLATATGSTPLATAQPAASGGEVTEITGWRVRIGGPKPTEARWAGKRLHETPLREVFANRPIVPGEERWPRVSIDITDYSETLVTPLANGLTWMVGANSGPPRPKECVRFNAVLWNSERDSRPFKDLVMCNSDIDPAVTRAFSVTAMRYYAMQAAPMPSFSSGQARTVGPLIPMNLVPQDTAGNVALWSNANYLFGVLFYQMRYRGPLQENDPRVWFVRFSKDRY